MRILIAGGTGFIGQALIKRWLTRNDEITVLGRDRKRIISLWGEQVRAMDWQQFTKEGCLANQDVVINLCGENIGSARWSSRRKQKILSSRIDTTTQIAQACARLGSAAPLLLNASAVGIYGLSASMDQAVTEEVELNKPTSFLEEIGHAWEQATDVAKQAGVSVVNLRFAVVLAGHDGAFPKLVRPFYFGMGGPIGSGQQPFAWVTLTDLCHAVEFIMEKPDLTGPINIVAPQCVTQAQLAKAIGKALYRPSMLTLPGCLVRCLFGAMGEELLLNGQWVMPQRLLHLGFKFQFADIEVGLKEVLR